MQYAPLSAKASNLLKGLIYLGDINILSHVSMHYIEEYNFLYGLVLPICCMMYLKFKNLHNNAKSSLRV